MRIAPALLAVILTSCGVGSAQAGEAGCWFENGAVVAPAEIAGIAGDWLLDPSEPHTLLHETRAEMEGLPGAFRATGHVAGQTLDDVQVAVADLDGRAPGFPTPIAGVIGADVLERFVVDLQFSPCRLRLSRDRPPPFGPARRLTLLRIGGVPAVAAAISDDRTARSGAFAVDWSSRAAVRVSGASVSPVSDGLDPTIRSRAPARLRALSVDGRLYEEQSAAVASGLDPALAGTLGVDFWSLWRVRLDIGRGRLYLTPN
jgi:hypothetical protein